MSNELKAFVVAMAAYYDKTLSDDVVKFYAADLEDLSIEEIKAAFKKYRTDPKNNFAPRPAHLRAIARPPVDDRSVASDLVQTITAKIRRHGYNWGGLCHYDGHKSLSDAIKAEIGELGHEVICRWGGWKKLHDDFWGSNYGTFEAQLREFIESTIRLSKAGALRKHHSLPEPAEKKTERITAKGALKLVEDRNEQK